MLFRILQGQTLIIMFEFKWSIFGGGQLLMPSANRRAGNSYKTAWFAIECQNMKSQTEDKKSNRTKKYVVCVNTGHPSLGLLTSASWIP